jgi:single-stranded-DNA-specific exonuclease
VHKRWVVNRTNPEFIKYLSAAASISPVLAQILINRGLKTSAEISSFLNAEPSQLTDPFEMEGMKTAVERISIAAKAGEKVFVHGDYDVDGLTATAILVRALRGIGIDCHYFIPSRMVHGYGFKSSSVKEAKQAGATLVITVDCGITSFEAAALCKQEGIDVIITDHHEPVVRRRSTVENAEVKEALTDEARLTTHDFLLPDAVAIINPKLSGLPSPVSHLSGAGVALKLAHALSICHQERFAVHEFMDLAALGTMADIVPLTGENRCIVKEGLRIIQNGIRPGVQALKDVAGIGGRTMKTGLLVFTLIPRINAAGRIDDANTVVKLLLTDSMDEAFAVSELLEKQNSERQRIEREVYQEALHILKEKGISPVIVLGAEGWHQGVVGIVASRITEEFHRPVILLSIEGGLARGSARSIPAFDMNRALSACKDLLRAFGGHKQAAGLDLEVKNISLFEECMNRIALETLTGDDFVPLLEIDADVEFSEITFNLTRELEILEPFGYGNPEPLLGSKGLEVVSPRIVKDKHLKMKLRQRSQSIDAIGFAMASFFENLTGDTTVDAVFTPSVHEWEESRYLQLNLKALRPSQKPVIS